MNYSDKIMQQIRNQKNCFLYITLTEVINSTIHAWLIAQGSTKYVHKIYLFIKLY